MRDFIDVTPRAAPVRPHNRPDRAPCGVEGCGRGLYARGYCVMHYSRLRKRGALGAAGAIRRQKGEGSVNGDGYRVIKAPGHPLATAQGKLLEHRAVLYAAIGDGLHPCHWCGKKLPWRGGAARAINVDHLDDNRLNNALTNLVVSCLDCNTKRGAL